MELFLNFFWRSREGRQRLEQHRTRLYRIAFAWTHNSALADDLVQETMSKALQKSGQLRDPDAGEAWLYAILANCHRDHFRRQRETEDIDDAQLISDRTPERESGELQIVRRVRAAIGRVPDGQRQVVTLVDIEGFSYVEVARILEIPIGTVMSRLCRARATLKDILLHDLSGQPGAQEPKLRRVK